MRGDKNILVPEKLMSEKISTYKALGSTGTISAFTFRCQLSTNPRIDFTEYCSGSYLYILP